LVYSSALKMDAVSFSETSVNFYWTAQKIVFIVAAVRTSYSATKLVFVSS
jgi:hypothetical protein